MINLKFKPYIIKHSSPELRKIVRRKKFPNSKNWREYKEFFNTHDVAQKLIDEYEQHWETYWIERQTKEGEMIAFKRDTTEDTKCKKAG